MSSDYQHTTPGQYLEQVPVERDENKKPWQHGEKLFEHNRSKHSSLPTNKANLQMVICDFSKEETRQLRSIEKR